MVRNRRAVVAESMSVTIQALFRYPVDPYT